MAKTTDDTKTFRRCAGCNAYDGQQLWRLKVDPRFYLPGPIEGGDSHPETKARDATARKRVAESGFYEPKLETVVLGDKGLCATCAKRPRAAETNPTREIDEVVHKFEEAERRGLTEC